MMLSGITLGQYIPGRSFVHRLDPRTKILACAVMIMAVLVCNKPAGYVFLTLGTLLALGFAGTSPRLLVGILRPFWIILTLTLILQLFFTPGQALLALGPLHVTREGLVLGGQILWRLTLLIVFSSLLTLTTSPLMLTAALESLLKPLQRAGVPAFDLAMMMTIALRFVPTLLEEAQQIIKAQQSRGAVFTRGGLFQRVRGLVPLLVPLFAGAFRRAEELATAMEIRCYRVGANRTRMHQLRYEWRDYAVLAGTGALFLATLALRWWG